MTPGRCCRSSAGGTKKAKGTRSATTERGLRPSNDIQSSPDDFAPAFESAFARLQLLVLEACEGTEPWPARVAAAIHATLDFAADDPAAARILTVDALLERAEDGPRYLRMLSYFAEQLGEGAPRDARRPALTEQALVGGIAVMVADHLRAGKLDRLHEAGPELVQLTLLPYVGSAEAKRWARRPPPPPPG